MWPPLEKHQETTKVENKVLQNGTVKPVENNSETEAVEINLALRSNGKKENDKKFLKPVRKPKRRKENAGYSCRKNDS